MKRLLKVCNKYNTAVSENSASENNARDLLKD